MSPQQPTSRMNERERARAYLVNLVSRVGGGATVADHRAMQRT